MLYPCETALSEIAVLARVLWKRLYRSH